MRDIHISIVSHGQWHLVKHLLDDLNSLPCSKRFQVTLTLNIPESEKFDVELYSYPIYLVENESPMGFGENHNQAFFDLSIKGEGRENPKYFFVMNPDIRIIEDVFSVLTDDLDTREEVGVIAPLVRNTKGEIEPSCREVPTPWRIAKKLFGFSGVIKTLNNHTCFRSDWAAGMFLGFRSEVFELVNGFDANYFLYYEDVELCTRIWLNNFIVLINPTVSIIHEGQCQSHNNIRYLRWHLRSMSRFFLSGSYQRVKRFYAKAVKKQELESFNTQLSAMKKESLSDKVLKVSLITVAFNSEKTIEDTILSVRSQSYANLEYLVIDGASTDNTLDIIHRYTGVVTHCLSEADDGIYDAMNKGISLASGDVIGFINADDVLASSDVISQVAMTFLENDIDACYADLQYVDQKDFSFIKRYWRSSAFKPGKFAKGWCPPHPTFYVKKSIYERLGSFSLKYQLGNDVELMLRFLERYQIKSLYVPDLWVKMRMGGVSNNSIANIVLQNKEIFKAAKDNHISFNRLFFIFCKINNRLGQYFSR